MPCFGAALRGESTITYSHTHSVRPSLADDDENSISIARHMKLFPKGFLKGNSASVAESGAAEDEDEADGIEKLE